MEHGPDFSKPFIEAVIKVKGRSVYLNIKKQQGRIASIVITQIGEEDWTVQTSAYPQINADARILYLCGTAEGKHECIIGCSTPLKAQLLAFDVARVLKKLNEKWKADGKAILVEYKPVSYD